LHKRERMLSRQSGANFTVMTARLHSFTFFHS
jgi:hypothetical protein